MMLGSVLISMVLAIVVAIITVLLGYGLAVVVSAYVISGLVSVLLIAVFNYVGVAREQRFETKGIVRHEVDDA
ncbi:hypothetical protein [Celeribacter indicus]|nr:hypothetical protein [Celeribacter indicus]SDW39129.1 hypothetical protein SAMN05443573_10356 [Celeribacter indicus]